MDLTRVAVGKVRRGTKNGALKHEVSGVRLAAAAGLSHMRPADISEILRGAGPSLGQQLPEWQNNPEELIEKLAGMIGEWQRRDMNALLTRFQREGESLSAIAAFALGELQSLHFLAARQTEKESSDREKARCLLKLLVVAFFNPNKPESTGWALTEALSLVDTLTIMEEIIKPALKQTRRTPQQNWYLAYLIGAIRPQPDRYPDVREFLRKCVRSNKDLKLTSIAVDALAALRDVGDEEYFSKTAMQGLDQKSPSRRKYEALVRRKAIVALRSVGTLDTVRKLRADGVDRVPDLKEAFYETSRAIYWRHNAERD